MDVIASMEYFKPTSSIRYRDETMRKSKNQKYDAWINNLLRDITGISRRLRDGI